MGRFEVSLWSIGIGLAFVTVLVTVVCPPLKWMLVGSLSTLFAIDGRALFGAEQRADITRAIARDRGRRPGRKSSAVTEQP
jgi:hypothetical protein